MYINSTLQPPAFSGLRINGLIQAENIKKISEFTDKIEKHKIAQTLENDFNTDIILDEQFDTVSFSHRKYGSLSKYNTPVLAQDLFSGIEKLTENLKQAIKKAEKELNKSKEKYKIERRGC